MYLDKKTKHILLTKLHFSNSTIAKIDFNFELSAKTMGVMEILKRSAPSTTVKSEVLKQLETIQKCADKVSSKDSYSKVREANLEHYSFH